MLFLILGSAGPVRAITGEEWLRARVGNEIRAGATFESVDAAMARYFAAYDLDLKGVSQQSYDRIDQIRRAEKRAHEIARVMTFDLDGDGVVTREELEIGLTAEARRSLQDSLKGVEPTREQLLALRDKLMAPYLADDFRQDGRITLDEMQRAADEQRDFGPFVLDRVPLDLSPRGDGLVTREDYEAAVRRTFDSFHVNHDGVISPEEARAAPAAVREIEQRENVERSAARLEAYYAGIVPRCGIPRASPEAKAYLVMTDFATAVSDVALGDSPAPAGVADLIAPSGSGPVYLWVYNVEPMVWRISGAVDQIEAVVAAGRTARRGNVGVIGVSRDKIHLVENEGCFPPLWGKNRESWPNLLAIALGKPPAEILDDPRVGTLRLPDFANDVTGLLDGAEGTPATTKAPSAWSEFLKRRPGGLLRLDPTTIVANTAAKSLPVAPGAPAWRNSSIPASSFPLPKTTP